MDNSEWSIDNTFAPMRKFIILIAALCCITSLIAQSSKKNLEIYHLTGNFYVYITYTDYEGASFPSNSMYLVTNKGVVLFDTPWDSLQFQPLLDSIEARHHQKVVLCIATHFHADRTAGLEYYQSKGIQTWTSKNTYDLCKQRGEKQSEFYFTKDTVFTIGNYRLETFYPGAGHTKDNIVIWLNKDKILYGGCFVKSTEAATLGNIADANLKTWEPAVRSILKK